MRCRHHVAGRHTVVLTSTTQRKGIGMRIRLGLIAVAFFVVGIGVGYAAKPIHLASYRAQPKEDAAKALLRQALVQAGVFRNRAEAAGFLIEEGIRTQAALFERVRQKLAEIERLRAELRGLIVDTPA